MFHMRAILYICSSHSLLRPLAFCRRNFIAMFRVYCDVSYHVPFKEEEGKMLRAG